MGVAFSPIKRGTGYFPAISLSYGEKSLFNFGRRPFEYPVEGFSPLQSPAPLSTSLLASPLSRRAVSYLLDSLRSLLHKRTTDDDILITASIIFEYLAPILRHEYHVIDLWYPFLTSLASDNGLLETLVEWIQLVMEEFEWKQCMGYILQHIGFKCRTTGLVQAMKLNSENAEDHRSNTTPEPTCFPALALAVALFRIPHILNFATSLDGIYSLLELFITFKQPSKNDLGLLLPFVWWQGGEANPACSESRFLHDMGVMNAYVRVYEDLVHALVRSLLRANIKSFHFPCYIQL